jgi:hypothetical protein
VNSPNPTPPYTNWSTAATVIQDAVNAAVALDEIVVTDFTDSDGDGMNNWQEWRCGTDPTNALSALRLLSASATTTIMTTIMTVTWQSVAGVNYFLERATNLPPSAVFTPLATGIAGQSGATTYLDTTAVGAGPYFYRVGVGN